MGTPREAYFWLPICQQPAHRVDQRRGRHHRESGQADHRLVRLSQLARHPAPRAALGWASFSMANGPTPNVARPR